MSKFINLFIKGILVGIANIIPGVSGGTIAVVLRIFDQLIDAVNNFFKEPKKHIRFLLPIGLGAILGIGIFSKIIQVLLDKFSFPTTMFFIGIVVGSIPLIYNQAKKEKIKLSHYLISCISFLLVVIISLLTVKESNQIIDVSSKGLIKIFICGVISSSAMVLPGISGSFVMVLLGIYNVVILSISGFIEDTVNSILLIGEKGIIYSIKSILTSQYFLILFFVGIGIIIGIILISKIISILLEKAFSFTYFAILGLILGSIFAIFKDPITYQSYKGEGIPLFSILISIFTFIIGFFTSFKLGNEKS